MNFLKRLLKKIIKKLLKYQESLNKYQLDLKIKIKDFKNQHLYLKKKIKGKNNKIIHSNCVFKKATFHITGNNNTITMEEGVRLDNVLFNITGNNHNISLQNSVYIGRGKVWIEDSKTTLKIGKNTHIEHADFALTEKNSKVIIGENCLFAYDIDIKTGDSHSILDKVTGERINKAKDVIIKDRVWIAAHCVLLKGTVVQNDSIVGIGTIMTKAFDEANVVIAGNPGKIVKRDIKWELERK